MGQQEQHPGGGEVYMGPAWEMSRNKEVNLA